MRDVQVMLDALPLTSAACCLLQTDSPPAASAQLERQPSNVQKQVPIQPKYLEGQVQHEESVIITGMDQEICSESQALTKAAGPKDRGGRLQPQDTAFVGSGLVELQGVGACGITHACEPVAATAFQHDQLVLQPSGSQELSSSSPKETQSLLLTTSRQQMHAGCLPMSAFAGSQPGTARDVGRGSQPDTARDAGSDVRWHTNSFAECASTLLVRLSHWTG